MKGVSRREPCSAGFGEVEYAMVRWVIGNVEAVIREEVK